MLKQFTVLVHVNQSNFHMNAKAFEIVGVNRFFEIVFVFNFDDFQIYYAIKFRSICFICKLFSLFEMNNKCCCSLFLQEIIKSKTKYFKLKNICRLKPDRPIEGCHAQFRNL